MTGVLDCRLMVGDISHPLLPLPIAGLMTDKSAEEVANQYAVLDAKATFQILLVGGFAGHSLVGAVGMFIGKR